MKIKLFTIPNMLTLANLLCGSTAVIMALLYNNIEAAFWFIIAGAIFDFFDGFVARLLNSSSAIGGELDSLADVVSFGLAPAMILFMIFDQSEMFWQWSEGAVTAGRFSMLIVVAFSALRLAKFNVDDTQHTEFCGLPTPANALFFGSLGLLFANGELAFSREILVVLAVVMSSFLVSPIRMFAFKFKGYGWKGNQLRYLFILFSVVAIVFLQYFAIPVVILMYILISTAQWAVTLTK